MGKKNKKHLALAARIGCLVCTNNGYPDTPSQLHHIREFTGLACKGDDEDVIALCPTHHLISQNGEIAIHDGLESFENRYGTQQELLVQMKQEIRTLLSMCVS